MTLRALMMVNGLGLGNATRSAAVATALVAGGAEVAAMTSGNGAWFLGRRSEFAFIETLEPLEYARRDGRLDVAGTLAALPRHLAVLRANDRRLEGVLDRWRPDVVVLDSVYGTGPMRRRRLPIAALNNSDVVVASWRRFRHQRPPRVALHFHTVERADWLFHRLRVDRVMSPVLDPTLPPLPGPFRRIGPIVRPEFRALAGRPQPTSPGLPRVLVMLSGSGFGTRLAFPGAGSRYRVEAVGAVAPEGASCGSVRWHGRVEDTAALLAQADLAVVNGGFSAVSETLVAGVPTIVVPIPNHAEQWLNAATVAALGTGLVATPETLEPVLLDALERLPALRARRAAFGTPPDGAAAAAAGILQLAREHRR